MAVVKLGFEFGTVHLQFDQILPSRQLRESILSTRKYRQIVASIQEIGLIEPLTVGYSAPGERTHLLLDGHMRFHALRELDIESIPCLISTDDETYTYNNRINRLSTIQEHYMIRNALKRGVAPEKLARALNIDMRTLIRKNTLLEGICPEASELLKDRQFSVDVARALRKMKPNRQVECVELMLSANNLTISYAEALVVASPVSMLVEGKKPSKLAGLSQEQILKMEREMNNVQEQYKLVEQSYGQDVLNMVLARGYLAKLLGNKAVSRYLSTKQQDVFAEFENIVHIDSLEK